MKEETARKHFYDRIYYNPNGCWEWLGKKVPSGGGLLRGRMFWNGKSKQVTHISYFLEQGSWPKYQINHRCNNPICINPDHIYDGSQKENVVDMYAAGRQRYGNHKGVNNANVKLTDKKVLQIRKLHETGKYTLHQLAKKFKVSHVSIWYIVKLRTWTNI